MSVVGGWVFAPLVLAVLVVGHGLLAERLASVRLPGALVPAVGLAGVIAVGGGMTLLDATAELAPVVLALVAVAGVALARPWSDPRLRPLPVVPLLVALGAYAVFAAPSLLTGHAFVAGYVKLDDSATWLALTAHVFEHGRDLGGLPPSSYARTLQTWLGTSYPIGAFVPLGAAARLSGQDPAAAYQAVIALYGAVLALGLLAVVQAVTGSFRRAGVAAFIGVQASMFLGYTQWGGIKEAASAALLPALAVTAVRAGDDLRQLIPLALAGGAMLTVLGPNGMAWTGPALVVAAIALVRAPRPRLRSLLTSAWTAAVVLGVAALPALAEIEFVRHSVGGGVIANQEEMGNLVKPLPVLQGAGLWPVGDFRFDPALGWAVVLLAVTCLLAAAAAVAVAARERRFELPAFVGITLAGALPAVYVGAPWIDAKALAVASPSILVAAAVIAVRPLRGPKPAVALASGAVSVLVLGGVAWSTLDVIDDVYVAPRERLDEVREIGERLGSTGPAVVLDPEIYASRYFLREAQAEGASDLRYRRVERRDGTTYPKLATAEVDELAVGALWAYRVVVRRRSPVASRPPTGFRLREAGRYWEVWQRPPEAPQPLARLPLGTDSDPAAVPGCRQVGELAETPGARVLAAFTVPTAPVVADLEGAKLPAAWRTDAIRAASAGEGAVDVELPAAGRWRAWVGGGALGRMTVEVDGEPVGDFTHLVGHGELWTRLDALPLGAGAHRVTLRHETAWRGGTGFTPPVLGPVVFTLEEPGRRVEVPVDDWRDLCDGRRLDWIDVLG